MYDPDPCLQNFFCHTWESLAGLMYVDGICGLVLLLQAVILYVPLRRQGLRWFMVVPLALAVAAFVLAYHMWSLYRQSMAVPHFPPGWFDSWSTSSFIGPYGLLTTALIISTATLLVPSAAAAITLLRNAVKFVVKKLH